MGTEHSVTNVRFQETEFHWPLFGNEFEEVTVASVPTRDIHRLGDPVAAFRLGAGVQRGV